MSSANAASLTFLATPIIVIVSKAVVIILEGGAVEENTPKKPQATDLGSYLTSLRTVKGLTLREVQEATGGEVSNAYLSQLEHGRISKPSPNILHSLATVYGASYETLMKKAGYITESGMRGAATFAISDLTPDEEDELLNYLAYIRGRKRRR